jgi:hypothetical protein
MANATVNAIGQINGAGATDALFLKMFGGEVITSFNNATVTQDKQMIRDIQSGKSASFPATGKITAAYHTPGTELVGVATNANERIITIDDLLVANTFIAEIDEAKNHYDVRAPLTDQLGDALAQAFDKNSLQVMVLAARASATITGQVGGSAVTAANSRTDAAVLSTSIFTAAQKLDEAFAPSGERFVFVLPAQYWLAAQATSLINKDWSSAGDLAKGTFESLAGIKVVKTNNLPQTNVSTGPSAYQGNFTNTSAVVIQKGAIGTVRLVGLSMRSDYDPRRLGTLLVAKYALGTGILRPHCGVEVKVA